LGWLLIQFQSEAMIISGSETYWQAHAPENANSIESYLLHVTDDKKSYGLIKL
jgi:hypothetical protein